MIVVASVNILQIIINGYNHVYHLTGLPRETEVLIIDSYNNQGDIQLVFPLSWFINYQRNWLQRLNLKMVSGYEKINAKSDKRMKKFAKY